MPKLSNQSEAWQRGYDWASGVGSHHELDIWDACEALGYDFDSNEWNDFGKGVDFRQLEQAEDRMFG